MSLTHNEIYSAVHNLVGVTDDHLLGFSQNSLDDFLTLQCSVDTTNYDGLSKARRLKKALTDSPPETQSRITLGLLERFPNPSSPTASREQHMRGDTIRSDLRAAAARILAGSQTRLPTPADPTAVVTAALRDAEVLLRERGPASVIDRVHTAFHGYLKAVCANQAIAFPPAASTTHLYGLLRNNHPTFIQLVSPKQAEILRILRGMSVVIDAVQPIRNEASLAHPADLMGEAEAHLVIDSVSAVFRYVDAKLRSA